MKCLIIGGTGTLTSGITKEALSKGYEVHILNRGTKNFRCEEGAKLIVADIYDEEKMNGILSDQSFDVVVDSISYVPSQLEYKIKLFEGHCKQYIFISSCAVFSESDKPVHEGDEKNNKWSYGINKRDCEKLLTEGHNSFKYTIVRPGITFGEIRVPYPVTSRVNAYDFIRRVLDGKPIVGFEDKGVKIQLMQVVDFSKLFVSLFGNYKAYDNDFNIASHNRYSWDDVIKIVERKVGKKAHVYKIPVSSFARVSQSLCDDLTYNKGASTFYSRDKIDEILKIEETPLESGINNTIDYLETNYKDRPSDESFEIMTDYLLMHCVSRKDEYLKKYIKTLDKSYVKKVNGAYGGFLRRVKESIKKSFLWKAIKK